MSNPNEQAGSGFHFGNVGGNVSMDAGGDIVGRDKVMTVSTSITKGFTTDAKKQHFQEQIDQLSEALIAVQAQVASHPSLEEAEKKEVSDEICKQLKALREAKDETADLSVGKEAPAETVSKVESSLKKADGVLEKLQSIGKKSGAIVEMVGQFAAKYGPLILSARHLFGLP